LNLVFSFQKNIKVISEANNTDHWTKKNKRHQQQQFLIRCAWNESEKKIVPPCTVKITRLGVRELDWSNLVYALKWIQDELAACILPEKVVHYTTKNGTVKSNKGFADSDKRITWLYEQEWYPISAVRVEIYQEQSQAHEECA